MGKFHAMRFPGESDDYRGARDALLAAEIGLRGQVAAVAALRQALPIGGAAGQDYLFQGSGDATVRLSDLFAPGKDTLICYSFMYAPADEEPCSMCSAFLDSLNGSARHVAQHVNLAVIAKAPIATLQRWADRRGWDSLRLLSSGANSYNTDYCAERPDGGQLPMLNVFQKISGTVFHRYATEMLFAASEPDQEPRHIDMLWPLWNVLDMTPGGRGGNWHPSLGYD